MLSTDSPRSVILNISHCLSSLQVKLRRLLRYIHLKDTKASVVRNLNQEEETEITEGEKLSQPLRKRMKMASEFLTSIDGTGELTSLIYDTGVDTVKHERMLRADLQSRVLDQQQYLEFCESRQSSFSKKYRFKDWVMAGVNLDIKLSVFAMEILGYFTYEAIAQIIDLTLLVKKDQKTKPDDPVSHLLPPLCQNHPDAKLATLLVSDISNASVQTPPVTPTLSGVAPGQGSTTPFNQSAVTTPNSVVGGKVKSKKRKKSGPALPPTIEPLVIQAIQPSDIHEAIRRYNTSLSPFSIYTKLARLPQHHWLLCC